MEDRQALIEAVGRATQSYQRATDGYDDLVGRVLGLNPTDLRCLDWLTEGPMSAGELGVASGLSSAATTTLLDRLERRGFVRRERDAADRRRILVGLTPEGAERIASLYGPLAVDGGRLLARFTNEQLAMLRDFLADATAAVDRRREELNSSVVEAGPTDRPAT